MAATEKVCTRLPTPGAVWIHQIHAAGEVCMVQAWVAQKLLNITF